MTHDATVVRQTIELRLGLTMRSMFSLLARKALRMAACLLGVTLLIFLLMRAIPGNPWANYATQQRFVFGGLPDTSYQRELIRRYGLDQPEWRQFTRYVFGDFDADGTFFCGAVCGNLGPSIQFRGPSVQRILFDAPEDHGFLDSRFGYTLRIVLFGTLAAIGLGVPLGILTATRPRSTFSRAISFALAGLASVPNFILGLIVILILGLWLKITTVIPNWNRPGDWIAPVLVLAAVPMATIARVTHATLANILGEDYVRTARAKGLTRWRVMLRHVLRPSLAPILTLLGPLSLEMLTASQIVEGLYGFPGFGQSFFTAVLTLDYPMILGVAVVYATAILGVNLLVGVLCELVDPRLRVARQTGVTR